MAKAKAASKGNFSEFAGLHPYGVFLMGAIAGAIIVALVWGMMGDSLQGSLLKFNFNSPFKDFGAANTTGVYVPDGYDISPDTTGVYVPDGY